MNTDRTDLDAHELINQLQDADQVVRLHAATVLGSMAEDAALAVPALIDLLNTGDVHDRKLAALTLGEIGPCGEDAVTALLDAANDEDDGVSEMAIWALEQIDLADAQEQAA